MISYKLLVVVVIFLPLSSWCRTENWKCSS